MRKSFLKQQYFFFVVWYILKCVYLYVFQIGEYRSDDNDSVSLRGDDNAKSEIDDNSHQAVEAMLMMSNFNTPEPAQSKGMINN